ncbi:MAG: bifunctional nicotinamidase/pyrazinamidase [Verrucomicrobiae bacterium]|nr:bifunctional nicotinamidase/pyrazinamidase [Verrucomicrobiae bacterium]
MTALIIVDVQRDFLPGGALPVPEGDAVIPVLNRIQTRYPLVALTQDWHPPDHLSFASQHPGRRPLERIELDGLEQVLWPDHCVWNSPGAALADALDTGRAAAIFRKGMDRRVDSYSGFFDNGRRRKTGLAEWLRGLGVTEVHVAGLAADYCVAYTARDAAELGFRVAILEDATRPISAAGFAQIAAELRQRGVRIGSSDSVRPG